MRPLGRPVRAGGAGGAGGRDGVGAVRAADGQLVGRSVGPEREPERGQVGAGQVVRLHPVAAAGRGGVDALDPVEVHRDVADVAREADARAVRGCGEALGGAGAVEDHGVDPVVPLDGVAAVAGVPGEAVVAGAEERAVVALVAVGRVVAVAAEEGLGRGAAGQRVVVGSAVGRERERGGRQAGRGDAVEAREGVDDQLVAPGLGARQRERGGDAGHGRAAVRAGHVDRVVELRAVDDRAVGRRVGVAEVGGDGLERGAGEVVGRERVGACERPDVDLLERAEVERDAADVAHQPRAQLVGRKPERLVRAGAVEGERVAAGRAVDRVAPVAGVPVEAIVPGAEPAGVVAAPAVDEVVAVARDQPLGAAAAQQGVAAAAALEGGPRLLGEDDPGLVDPDAVVAGAGAHADPVEAAALREEVGRAVVADVDLELARPGAQCEPVARAVAGDGERPLLDRDGVRRVGRVGGQ